MLYWLYETHCTLLTFNAINSMFLILYNLPITNNILLFYNTFFRKDLNGKLFFSRENTLHYILLCNIVKLIHWL